MSTVQAVLDEYAGETPYDELARAFLERDRWTADDPILWLAEAAASCTGQRFVSGVKPTVERFRDEFVETGDVDSFESLAAIDVDDERLIDAFGAQRKRRVLVEAASVLARRTAADDLTAVTEWAAGVDIYRYRDDPVGVISGVGPSTVQYLRMLTGVDTVKPDPEVIALVEVVTDRVNDTPLDPSEPLRTVASCEWMAYTTSYRMIDIDRIAWWTFIDEAEREAIV